MRRLLFLALSVSLISTAAHAANSMPFGLWLEQFKAEALKEGIPQPVIDDAFAGIAPDDRVVDLDHRQPESKLSFNQYAANMVGQQRITRGQEYYQQYEPLLDQISARYQVQPQYILALWGMETHYGEQKGTFEIIPSLATLAYEGRRAEFFRRELMNALIMLRDEHILAASLIGSWAGAMGNCQFMPTSYLKYAVDWDGDSHRDIWNSLPDSFASIANYLHSEGWRNDISWGEKVLPPQDLKPAEADLYTAHPTGYWVKRGVTKLDGTPLTGDEKKLYLVYPGASEEGTWLVTENYHILLKWNRSRYFATSTGLLADKIAEVK